MNRTRSLLRATAASSLVLLAVQAAQAADSGAGMAAFRTQCLLCHSAEANDNGGAQGPSLAGVFGREAASNPNFSYTAALKNAHLTWDAATLDRFLTSPTTVVPGSNMVIPVPKSDDRQNIIAYFSELKAGTFKPPAPRGGFGPPPGGSPPPAVKPTKGEADWKKDAPGRMHKVEASKLPPTFDTPSATQFPRVVPKPADAKISVPAGFKVDTWLADLTGPRNMRLAPNKDIFITETNSGKVKVLRTSADGAKGTVAGTFAQGLVQPYGLAFVPANNPKWLYVAEVNRVVRYPYKTGDVQASAVPEVIIGELSPTGGGHFTRDIGFSPDGKRMYVSVGSQSNVAEDITKKTPAEIKDWESKHGLGAAWDKEQNRAAVLVFDAEGKNGKTFASGIRNCVGLNVNPKNGDVWCSVNERDGLGDDLVPDYSTRVKEGGYYGWPWYYMGANEDPRLKDHRPDLKGKATVPDVLFTAHSAATNMVFYDATSGSSVFPAEYRGEAFTVLHGSWNRAFRTGHKIVRLKMKNGVPTGEYQDFLTGFIVDENSAWGRPVAMLVQPDGSLLLADDGANLIYRISYTKQ